MKQKRLLLLLALLITAATGAWAQDAKHLITATYDQQTRSLEQPLPYATTVGELYEAVTGESFSDLITTMSHMEMPLNGISSTKTDVVSIGGFNGASTTVTVKADGKAAVALRFGNYTQGIFVSVTPPLYVTMKDGVKDAAKWTATVGTSTTAQALPVGGLSEGDPVTLNYSGDRHVKSVTATSDAKPVWDGDLSKLTAESTEEFATATDGMIITGTLAANVKVSIANGATVTLDGVTINGVSNFILEWAGITCLGDATIILKDGTENTVKGFVSTYPGIYVPENKTLTIQGSGSLTASSNGQGCGIGGGGGYQIACGNIVIAGGTITANGGYGAAGIGSCNGGSCGYISITGGTVNATGGERAAGIGGGFLGSCGTVTITDGVTSVTATKGDMANYSIGAGNDGSCGTVTIGGTLDSDGNIISGTGSTGPITTSPYTYLNLATVTEATTVGNGYTVTGALGENVKISIAEGATVTLDGVTINGVKNNSYKWAGINCLGDATIILSGTNTVKGFHQNYPGIHVPVDKTLTIEGSGSLTASSNGAGCGIGGGNGGNGTNCGNIVIAGGTINATGGDGAAGIGSGFMGSCGNISITGGTVNATGGIQAAGIGSGAAGSCGNISITGGTVTANGGSEAAGIGGGYYGSCGTVTITDGVTSVTATKGDYADYSIGAGNYGECGTVTIGGTKYWENNAAVGDGATYLAQATIVYPAEETVTLATPLTIEAITDGTIQVNMSGELPAGMKYSVNGGTKTTIYNTTSIEGLKAGDKVQFYGNGAHTKAYGDDPEVSILGIGYGFKTKVYGNIMSLLYETDYATNYTALTSNNSYAFYGLFWGNYTLIDASELLLPATTLAYGCYQNMFYGCSNLTTAPKLPATTLASSCYNQMFYGCIKLTSAYVKAAYTEANDKCIAMFDGCTATGAVLHTTSDNKASWKAVMGTGKNWSTWTVADDWQD